MMSYISQDDYCIGCRFHPVVNTVPRPDDFRRVYFKIDDVIYFEWSNEFAKLADQEILWRRLKT